MICGRCDEKIKPGDSVGHDVRLNFEPDHLACLLDWLKANDREPSTFEGRDGALGAGMFDQKAAVRSLR